MWQYFLKINKQFSNNIQNSTLGTHCDTAPSWMSQNCTNGKWTLAQVTAWCRQETNHYLSQCWPRFMSPYGIIRPQWKKRNQLAMIYCHFSRNIALFYFGSISWLSILICLSDSTKPLPEPMLTSNNWDILISDSFYDLIFLHASCKIFVRWMHKAPLMRSQHWFR